jgi:hypothetical protein
VRDRGVAEEVSPLSATDTGPAKVGLLKDDDSCGFGSLLEVRLQIHFQRMQRTTKSSLFGWIWCANVGIERKTDHKRFALQKRWITVARTSSRVGEPTSFSS